MSFSPGSPPWLHLLVNFIEHQHNLCFHSDTVGTESWLTKSRGGRAGKPFLPHLGDQPGLNWMSFLSHAILLCNIFSLFLFFFQCGMIRSQSCGAIYISKCSAHSVVVVSLVTSPHTWLRLFPLLLPGSKASSWLWAGFVHQTGPRAVFSLKTSGLCVQPMGCYY